MEPLASTRQLINNFIVPDSEATHSSLHIRPDSVSEEGSVNIGELHRVNPQEVRL